MFKVLIPLISLAIFCTGFSVEKTTRPEKIVSQSPFIGEWDWAKSNDHLSFNIDIKQFQNKLIGQYCGSANKGDKVDCADGDDISFEVPIPVKNSFTCSFASAYSGNKGIVQLSIQGKYLIWKIVKAPKGEFYCPVNAKLVK